MKPFRILFCAVVLLGSSSAAQSTLLSPAARTERDLIYKTAGGRPQKLDLFFPPEGTGPFPVIVWIHGGGWRSGSKENCLPARTGFPQRGFAVASVNYRLTDAATFPAQIEDCKAAVRWLRAHAGKYGLDAERFGAWGSSAGGHLAALLGTSDAPGALDTGDHLEFSSRVQAVCDYYGPADLCSMAGPDGFERHARPEAPVSMLLGGAASENPDLAKAASPVSHVSSHDPPFLIVHGDKDRTVPVEQSRLLHQALRDAQVESDLLILPGAGHGGPAFSSSDTIEAVAAFFDRHLKRRQKE